MPTFIDWTTDTKEFPVSRETGFHSNFKNIVVHIQGGTGTVSVQRRNSTGAWEEIESLTGNTNVLDVRSMPRLRFVSTNATYKIT